MNELPVPNEVPPIGMLYQLIVPLEALASSVTVPASQRDAGDVEVIVGIVFMVAVIAVLVGVVQPEATAST